MSIEEKFKIEVDLRPGGKKETFLSIKDYEQWINVEKEFWDWGQDWRTRNEQAYRSFHGANQSRLSVLRDYVGELKKAAESENEIHFQRVSDNLKNELTAYYKKSELLHSSTPVAKYIKTVSETDKVHAAYIYQSVTEPKQQDWAIWRGKIAHMLFDWNIKNKAVSEEAALRDLQNQFAEGLNESKERLENLIKIHENNSLNHLKQLDEQRANSQRLIEDKEKEINSFIEETKKRFHEIEEFYEKKLGLHSAITYWGDKANYHNIWAGVFTLAVGFAFVGVGVYIYKNLAVLIGEDTIDTVQLWKLGVFGISATIGVWLLRIVVRLLLSNLHLGNDARERRTMLLTYLAMQHKNELPADADSRHLILQALFRPSSSGIVKDDATPPFMAEWLKRTTGHD